MCHWPFLNFARLMMEVRRNSEEDPYEIVHLSHEKVPSDAIKKNSKKLHFCATVAILLIGALAATAVTSLAFSLQQNRQSGSFVNITASKPAESPYPTFGKDVTQKEQEHIEVVGDRKRFLILEAGSRLRHWKTSTRSGSVRLKHHTFIVIQVPGLYRVYGQFAVFNPNETGTYIPRVRVMLMRNRMAQCTSIVENCQKICTKSFSKTIRAQKDDNLSMQSGSSVIFALSPKLSYFGVNKLD